MALCTRCAKIPAYTAPWPMNLDNTKLFNSEYRFGYPDDDSLRSIWKKSRNRFCEDCGTVFLTPAESTDHAQTQNRHFCFICNIDAHFPLEGLPDQYCRRVIEQDRHIAGANANASPTLRPQVKTKSALGHDANLYNSPYSTQYQNLKVAKGTCIADAPQEWEAGLTEEQRAYVDVKAAVAGQEADFLSDRDMRHLARVVQMRGRTRAWERGCSWDG